MFKPSISWTAAAAALPAVLACLPLAAQAQVYKCRQPDGTTAFQGSPCPGSIKAPVPAAPVNRAARSGDSTSAPFSDPYAQAPNTGQRGTLALPPTRPVVAAVPEPQVQKPARAVQQPKGTPPRESSATSAENERIRQENEKTTAYNKTVKCNNARQQLRVVQEQHAIFSTDNKGERHYVDDKDRQKVIDSAQQRVNAECN